MDISTNYVTATKSIGVKLQGVEDQKYNLWIGVSFGNKFFTSENVSLLVEFCLKYTRDKILIWLPGRMHATNYKYIENFSRARALREAFKDEENKKIEIQKIISMLPTNEQKKIILANYDDVCTPTFIRQRETLFREFSKEGLFYKQVIEITKEILSARGRTLTRERLEAVSLYVLEEIPLFLDGLQTIDESTLYSAIVYPGMGKLDELVRDIQTKKVYGMLRKDLKIKHEAGIIDIQLSK